MTKPQQQDNGKADRQPPTRVAQLRVWFGMSQKDWATFMGKDQAEISRMENGKQTPHYRDFAVATGVSVDWLMELSTDMWGQTVHKIRRAIQDALVNLTPEEKAELASPRRDQSDQIKYVLNIARSVAPDLMTDDFVLRLLGMDPEEFAEKIVSNETYLERSDYARFAEYFGVSLEFIELGSVEHITEDQYIEYRSAIARLNRKGVTAEKLNSVLDILL